MAFEVSNIIQYEREPNDLLLVLVSLNHDYGG